MVQGFAFSRFGRFGSALNKFAVVTASAVPDRFAFTVPGGFVTVHAGSARSEQVRVCQGYKHSHVVTGTVLDGLVTLCKFKVFNRFALTVCNMVRFFKVHETTVLGTAVLSVRCTIYAATTVPI